MIFFVDRLGKICHYSLSLRFIGGNMATMNISLPEILKNFLDTQVQGKRSPPLPLSWERGHLGRYFSGRDVRAPRGE